MKRLAVVVVSMVAVLLLAGCASQGPTATPQAVTVTQTVAAPGVGATTATIPSGDDQPPTEPANPVPILKRIKGCVLEAGTEVGQRDINGNRYAGCDFLDNAGTSGTSVTVRTYAGDPKVLETMPENLQSDDSHKVIVGPDFIASVTGDWASYSKNVDPAAIARQVGGKLIPPK